MRIRDVMALCCPFALMTVSEALMTVHDMMTLVTVYDGLAGSVVFCAHDVGI
jgi:hypothetical protein